jgi:hypothetical protein
MEDIKIKLKLEVKITTHEFEFRIVAKENAEKGQGKTIKLSGETTDTK